MKSIFILILCLLSQTLTARAGTPLTSLEIRSMGRFTSEDSPWIRVDLSEKETDEARIWPPGTRTLLSHALVDGALTYATFHIDSERDKLRHFFAGYVISNASAGTLSVFLPDHQAHRELIVSLVGFGVGVAAGALKELSDLNGHGVPSLRDAVATAAGAGLGALSLRITLPSKPMKKERIKL
jgi:hypothetical protein